MKKQIITVAFFFITAVFMVSCGNSNKEKSTKNSTEEVKTAKHQCPMKCEGEKIYDESGTCPVCEMDLEIVLENEHHHHKH